MQTEGEEVSDATEEEVMMELPDSRMQRFACFGRRAIWQFKDKSGAFERGKIEGAEFDSDEQMLILPKRFVRECWKARKPVDELGCSPCCWSCLISGGSIFRAYNRQPLGGHITGHFASYKDAECWVKVYG